MLYAFEPELSFGIEWLSNQGKGRISDSPPKWSLNSGEKRTEELMR